MKPLRLSECGLWALVLIALLAILFPGFFFSSEVLSSGDLLSELVPWRDYRPADYEGMQNVLMYDPLMAFRPDFLAVRHEFGQGRWPLWNPLEYGGVPLLANYQSRVFYPPYLLLLFFDVDTAMSLFIVVKLWIAGLVAYVCARLLGFSIWGSRFYSIAWAFGCFLHVWAYWPITDVATWVPVTFLGTEWLAQRRYRRGFFALLFGGVLTLLAGHPESAFAINFYMVFYFAIRLALERRQCPLPWKGIGLFACAWALSLATCAMQLAPFIEYLANSYPVGERVEMPLTVGALTSFWTPRFWGTNAEFTFWDKSVMNSNLTIQHYVGMAVWMGVALLLFNQERSRENRFVLRRRQAAAFLFAGGFGLAVGMNMPSLAWLHRLPGFGHMRMIYNVYFLLFALPILGTMGLEKWFSKERKLRQLSWTLTVILPAAILVALVYAHNRTLLLLGGHHDYVVREMGTWILMTAIAVGLLAVHCFRPRSRYLWPILVVFLFVDVVWPVRGLNPSLRRQEMFPDTQMISYMQSKPAPCRFDVSGAAIVQGTIGNFRLEEWNGYDGLFPERPLRFRNRLGTKIWDKMVAACAVDYYLHDPRYDELFPLEELRQKGRLSLDTTLDGLELYRHAQALPRVRLVGNVECAESAEALFVRMLEDSFDPAISAITERPPAGPLPRGNTTSPGKAWIQSYSSNKITIACDAEQESALVLADTFYPGWRAYLDDNPVEIFPVYYTFRGVLVPIGKHVVEFKYQPRSLTLGIGISVASQLLGIGLALHALTRISHRWRSCHAVELSEANDAH